MRTGGTEKIVHGPDGSTWIVRGNTDGTYTAVHAQLTDVEAFRRSWQAVQAIAAGTVTAPTPVEPVGGVEWCVTHHGIVDEAADSWGPDGAYCDHRDVDGSPCDIRPLYHIVCQLDVDHDGDHVRDCAPVEAGERLAFSQHTVRWSDPCECDSHTGVGEDLWKCDECGEVIRYVDDPNGKVTLTTLHPYRNRRVRVEMVTPGTRHGNRGWWS